MVGLSASNARPGACTHVEGGCRHQAIEGILGDQEEQLRNRLHQKAKRAADIQPWLSDRFTLVSNLSTAGNRGRVDEMQDVDSGQRFAVKVYPNARTGSGSEDFRVQHPESIENPWQDLAVLELLNEERCPYVCELFGMYRSELETFMVSSLAVEGDLFTWCELAPSPGVCREVAARPLAHELLEALRYIHKMGLAHRDVSLENVLLMATGASGPRIRLCDFAQASVGRIGESGRRGKQEYRAPESLTDRSYDTFQADVFSAGVAIFGMVTHDYPWKSTEASSCEMFAFVEEYGLRAFLGERTLRNDDEQLLSQVLSEGVVRLLEGLLAVDPKKRLSLASTTAVHGKIAFEEIWLNADQA